MATIRKTPSGKYRVEVCINNKRTSKTFRTKSECNMWAAQQTTYTENPKANITFKELLERYRNEVSVKKKGVRWETIRINKILREEEEHLNNKKIFNITKADMTDWRERKLKVLSNSSVRREWCIVSNAFNTAIHEWDWLKENPLSSVKMPPPSPPRDRLISDEEIKIMEDYVGYSIESDIKTESQKAIAALNFSLETALRLQEICFLKWEDINGRVISIRTSKTRSGIREVPLSKKALFIIDRLKKINHSKDTVFDLKPVNLSAMFRKIRNASKLEGFTFHDARATAITRLSKKLDIYDLAKVIGHKDLSMLMVYYRKTVDSLADKLD